MGGDYIGAVQLRHHARLLPQFVLEFDAVSEILMQLFDSNHIIAIGLQLGLVNDAALSIPNLLNDVDLAPWNPCYRGRFLDASGCDGFSKSLLEAKGMERSILLDPKPQNSEQVFYLLAFYVSGT